MIPLTMTDQVFFHSNNHLSLEVVALTLHMQGFHMLGGAASPSFTSLRVPTSTSLSSTS
jgi:hypothetical protein